MKTRFYWVLGLLVLVITVSACGATLTVPTAADPGKVVNEAVFDPVTTTPLAATATAMPAATRVPPTAELPTAMPPTVAPPTAVPLNPGLKIPANLLHGQPQGSGVVNADECDFDLRAPLMANGTTIKITQPNSTGIYDGIVSALMVKKGATVALFSLYQAPDYKIWLEDTFRDYGYVGPGYWSLEKDFFDKHPTEELSDHMQVIFLMKDTDLFLFDNDNPSNPGTTIELTCGTTTSTPSNVPTVAVAQSTTVPSSCTNVQFLVDMSKLPSASQGLISTRPNPFPQGNMYEASEIKFTASANNPGASATLYLNIWEKGADGNYHPVFHDAQGNAQDVSMTLPDGKAINLEHFFFSNGVSYNDRGQRIVAPCGIIEIWQSDEDHPMDMQKDWYVKYQLNTP